jgi:hypothetical protein
MHAVPVSRFTRLQEALADTSNEYGDFTQNHRQPKNFQLRRPREHAQMDPIGARCWPQSANEATASKYCAGSIK